jgi:hypothetical protein
MYSLFFTTFPLAQNKSSLRETMSKTENVTACSAAGRHIATCSCQHLCIYNVD